jgi:molybdopterin-guanine dinucleotide biosynthesis protein A
VPTAYDAVVLAGGRSRRMRVSDKTALTVGGVSLLDRVLQAAINAASVVVVGPERSVGRDVTWVLEERPGGGPAAAVAAALPAVSAVVVVLLAADLPLLSAAHVDRLVESVGGDGAVYVDADGAEQWLCSAWRTATLRSLPLVAGDSLRRALAPLDFNRLTDTAAAVDCDTPDDLHRAEEMLT